MSSDSLGQGFGLQRIKRLAIGAIALAILVAMLLPGGHAPEAGRRSNCVNNLKQIGVALSTYHDAFKAFPPAYTTDAEGKPMHSWRVLLLPYFESPTELELYQQYDFDEPWDGPHNRKLSEVTPGVFRCPSPPHNENETCYVAVVGMETMWPGKSTLNWRQIHDGASNTICVVEMAHSGIHWTEPRDLRFEDAVRGINVPKTTNCISSNHNSGAMFLFVDASVHFLTNDIQADVLRALLTANGGDIVQIPDQ